MAPNAPGANLGPGEMEDMDKDWVGIRSIINRFELLDPTPSKILQMNWSESIIPSKNVKMHRESMPPKTA